MGKQASPLCVRGHSTILTVYILLNENYHAISHVPQVQIVACWPHLLYSLVLQLSKF